MSTSAMLLYVRIISASLWIACLLPLIKLPHLLRIIESKKQDTCLDEKQLQALIDRINRIVRFKFFVIRNNCLKKSLLLYYFLLRSGVRNVSILIGVSKTDLKLDGHCWLTLNGGVFQDSEAYVQKYTVIYSSGVR